MRHQLHQALRSLGRHRPRIKPTLRMDHAVDQIRIQVVPAAGCVDHFVHRLGSRHVFFETIDVSGRNVHIPIAVGIQIKTCDRTDYFTPLVANRKPVPQQGDVCPGGKQRRPEKGKRENELTE